MTLDQAIHELRTAQRIPAPGCPWERIAIPTEAARTIVKQTNDAYLRHRLEDAAEWNEPTLRIHAEDRVRLLAVLS